MKHNERESLVAELAQKGEWDRAIEHAKALPSNFDIWQRFPTFSEDGMPDHAINKVLDHFKRHNIHDSGFMYEIASNLLGHNQTETLQRLAQETHDLGGSYTETKNIVNHPNYKPKEEYLDLLKAKGFWDDYERKVLPHHFAVIKSLFSGKPETVIHRDTKGSSVGFLNSSMPHLFDYARKIQDKILKDEDIRKRTFNNEPYIKVYRGVGGHYADKIRDASGYHPTRNLITPKYLTIPTAPFSSWTTNEDMARRFAMGRGVDLDKPGFGIVFSKWMPVKDILHSGFHSFIPGHYGTHEEENEIVFGHKTGKMKINTGEMQFERLSHDGDSTFSYGVQPHEQELVSKSIKDRALALGVAAAMIGIPEKLSVHMQNQQSAKQDQNIVKTIPLPGLKHIEFIESTGGKHKEHPLVTSGLNANTRAVGRYGMMPLQIIETARKDKKLSSKYPELLSMDHVNDHDKIHNFVSSTKGLEVELANSHWKRLYDIFNGNEEKMAHAWLNGITGTKNKTDEEISEHPYVKKYKRHKQLMELETQSKEIKLKKSEGDVPERIRNITEFLFFGEKTPINMEKVRHINQLIENKAFHPIPAAGQFTENSFVLGNYENDAWLMKIETRNRPVIISAREGLQAVKEVAFYDVAEEIFGLGDFVPQSLIGEVVIDGDKEPTAAIKMLPKRFKLAIEYEEERPGIMKSILEKYRKVGLLHKMAAMLFVLGDGDSHGKNVMTDGTVINLIDHGSSFADESFDPTTDESIFIPYIMRMANLQKQQNMPEIDNLGVKDDLKIWILSLDSHKLAQKLNNYGINPEPSVRRLKKLQNITSGNIDPDIAINKSWTIPLGG